MSSDYIPIDCEFHDVLEATATGRKPATLRYRDDDGTLVVVEARIADLYATGGVEYMRLDDGRVIRLDRIVGVGDASLSSGF